jgi:hypothetical protein
MALQYVARKRWRLGVRGDFVCRRSGVIRTIFRKVLQSCRLTMLFVCVASYHVFLMFQFTAKHLGIKPHKHEFSM